LAVFTAHAQKTNNNSISAYKSQRPYCVMSGTIVSILAQFVFLISSQLSRHIYDTRYYLSLPVKRLIVALYRMRQKM